MLSHNFDLMPNHKSRVFSSFSSYLAWLLLLRVSFTEGGKVNKGEERQLGTKLNDIKSLHRNFRRGIKVCCWCEFSYIFAETLLSSRAINVMNYNEIKNNEISTLAVLRAGKTI